MCLIKSQSHLHTVAITSGNCPINLFTLSERSSLLLVRCALLNCFIKTTLQRNQKQRRLDVVSVFTNIPLDLFTQIVKDRWPIIEQHCNFTYDGFAECLHLILENCHFSYNNKFYRQLFGAPIGLALYWIAY